MNVWSGRSTRGMVQSQGASVGLERVVFWGYKLVRVSFVCSSENSVVFLLCSFVRVK